MWRQMSRMAKMMKFLEVAVDYGYFFGWGASSDFYFTTNIIDMNKISIKIQLRLFASISITVNEYFDNI